MKTTLNLMTDKVTCQGASVCVEGVTLDEVVDSCGVSALAEELTYHAGSQLMLQHVSADDIAFHLSQIDDERFNAIMQGVDRS